MKNALKDLIRSKDKKIKTNFIFKIIDIDIEDEDDEIKVDLIDKSSKYQSLYLIKGEIFPTPKKDDFLLVKELSLKYDYYLKIKIYLNAEIINNKDNNMNSNLILEENHLGEDNLFDYLKNILNINEILYSSVFTIKDIDNNSHYYKLLNYKDMKEYTISIDLIKNKKKDEPILINNY